ncbi:MAG: anthranilate phosphoribosyltransferase [bacterium]|nr:anthranilate phosphoribosyltransferase [bacterium]
MSLETEFKKIMSGQMPEDEIISFLTTLRDRGETVEELEAAVKVLRTFSLPFQGGEEMVDTCGTGGDAKGTFNISTTVAFGAAGAGVKVAKHGNRSVSSKAGSADLLEALGVKIDLSPEGVRQCLEKAGIGFCFARQFPPAMKQVAAARQKIGTRTLFNLLGPLIHPARVQHQLIGVFDKKWIHPFATVLQRLGSKHVLVVHGEDGLDEITLTGSTSIAELHQGRIKEYSLDPRPYGFQLCSLSQLRGGDVRENVVLSRGVLEGGTGPLRDVVVLNAAAVLLAADRAVSLEEGITLAKKSLDQGRARETLENLIKVSNDFR